MGRAKDNNLGQWVAIKEYLPHDFAARSGDSTVQPVSVEQEDLFSWGLERFMTEAQTLAKFKHPNIVRVLSVFKHNNTGYMVMEYEQGQDLSDVYKQKKVLTQHELEDIYYPIIDGLSSVHKEGFIHRDIKPSNIFIRTDGSPVLIDFGAARQAVGSKTKALTSMLSIGYAPFEQYNDEPGKQGPWTDVYAMGASLHQGITGEKPMESTVRGMALLHNESDPYEPLSQSGIEGYSQAFLRAIDQALMMQIHDRPQTLEDFLGMLKGEIALPDLPVRTEKVAESTVIRDRTVVRPEKREFSGAGFEVTHPDQPIKNEAEAGGEEYFPDTYETEQNKQQPQQRRPSKQGWLTIPKFLFAMTSILAIIVAVIFFLPQEPSPEEIQQQKVDALLEKAGELIASGNYFDDSGKGALGIYRQILAIEPDNSAAKDGVNNVVNHYLQLADQFIDKKDFARADANLKIVNSIDPGFPGLKEALARYSQNLDTEKKLKQIEIATDLASKALEQGRIHEPRDKNALFYYEIVLKLDPENVNAKLGLFEIADRLTDQAQTALNKNDIKNAEKLISLAESLNPGKSTIKTLRQQIDKTRKLNQVLARADSAYTQNRYTAPIKDSAYELYKQVLTVAPSNLHAQKRLNEIADFYVNKARRSTQAGNLASANANLKILEEFFPGNADISSLKAGIGKKLSEAKKQIEIKKQSQISASTSVKEKPPTISKLLPIGVNQKQDDYQVVQDIVGLVINAFKKRDMDGLLKVSQLTKQQQNLYAKIFSLYQSLNVNVAPNSFSLRKNDGVAKVKFEITDLVDSNGNSVVTSANWTKIEIKITKQNGGWLKAEII
jgi:serine/threonine protein kinase